MDSGSRPVFGKPLSVSLERFPFRRLNHFGESGFNPGLRSDNAGSAGGGEANNVAVRDGFCRGSEGDPRQVQLSYSQAGVASPPIVYPGRAVHCDHAVTHDRAVGRETEQAKRRQTAEQELCLGRSGGRLSSRRPVRKTGYPDWRKCGSRRR
jgi:hypothetical protein